MYEEKNKKDLVGASKMRNQIKKTFYTQFNKLLWDESEFGNYFRVPPSMFDELFDKIKIKIQIPIRENVFQRKRD